MLCTMDKEVEFGDSKVKNFTRLSLLVESNGIKEHRITRYERDELELVVGKPFEY